MRGCIGSLEPTALRAGLETYALTSALRDSRFPPVAAHEIPSLACTVSLLRHFEPAAAWDDWEVGKHGIVLSFECPRSGGRRSATYLPHVASEQGWTRREAVDSLFRKAGHGGAVTDALRREARVTRYAATTASVAHDEWKVKARREARAAPAAAAGGRA